MAVIELTDLNKDKLQGAIENMERTMTTYERYLELLAQLRRKSFNAYIAQGFNEQQALVLCQNMML